MSTGPALPRSLGLSVASEAIEALGPACTRLEVAGSLRRGAGLVHDVELVAQSASERAPGGLLFESDEVVWALDGAVRRWAATGRVEHLAGIERYIKLRHVATGAQIDVFSVRPPAQFGLIYLIRTGPAAYSQGFVTDIRRAGFHAKDGSLHVGAYGCAEDRACEVVPTPEEEDVYRAVGFPYVPPQRRDR
jgi:DNA polymerase/3'-5' exonuclease PolX